MKVLKDNYTKSTVEEVKKVKLYPRRLVCEVCRSELEYKESDLRMGALGCMYLDCPCCGRDNMIEENENTITLTVDNIEFPTHFFHTSKEDGAVDCCNNNEVRNCIRRAIDYFRENKKEYAWQTEYGNLYIVVFRYDGDENYEVIVTNNFYTTYIPFEDIDYED